MPNLDKVNKNPCLSYFCIYFFEQNYQQVLRINGLKVNTENREDFRIEGN